MTPAHDLTTGRPPPFASLPVNRAHSAADDRDFIAAFFDGRVDRYDGSYTAPGSGRHVLSERLRSVLEVVGEQPGESLDVGMGAGRLCVELARRGWTVAGVDISEAMVRRAQSRLPHAAGRLHRAPVEQLPFIDSSFDLVTATGVIEYLHSLPEALAELARVLRPGGRIVLTVPNRLAPYAILRRTYDPIARFVRRAIDPSASRPPRGADVLGQTDFVRSVADAGLSVTASRYVSAAVVPAPLDTFIPGTAERLARLAERSRLARRVFATQIIVVASTPRRPSRDQRTDEPQNLTHSSRIASKDLGR